MADLTLAVALAHQAPHQTGASRKTVRTAAARKEGPLHQAADAHVAKLSVTFRYAFAVARKAVRPVLDAALLRTAAGFDPSQPRDEQGQWIAAKVSEAEAILAQAKADGRPVLFHSGDASIDEQLAGGIEPTFGPWLEEVLGGATDEEETMQAIRDQDPVSFFSTEPNWVAMKTARVMDKHVTDVTVDDIRQHGQLSIISVAAREPDDRNMSEEESKAAWARYDASGSGADPDDFLVRGGKYGEDVFYYGQTDRGPGLEEVPFGVEPKDIFSQTAIAPDITLTGDALVQFLERNFPQHLPKRGRALETAPDQPGLAQALADRAVAALTEALRQTLPRTVHTVVLAGGRVGMYELGRRRLRAAEFDPNQPRDDIGRWTDSAGGAMQAVKAKPLDTGPILTDKERTERRAKVERRAAEIAEQMSVDPSIIHVVDKEPRPFTVGNQQFREAGHYDPRTGEIEINARNSYDDRMAVTNGIAAHEVQHAIFDAARKAQEAEHKELSGLPPDEYNRLFRQSGYVKPEMQQEVHRRWPVSAMFYRHLGDSYMETEAEQQGASRFARKAEALKRDDGVSEYSKAYWQEAAVNQSGGFERAMNETLAETARFQLAPLSGNIDLKASWLEFRADLQRLANSHPSVKARLSRKTS